MPAALRRQVREQEKAEEEAEAKASAATANEEVVDDGAVEPEAGSEGTPTEETSPEQPAEETPPTEATPSETVSRHEFDELSAKMAKAIQDSEQRYRTLQGKYNSEVPRLQNENSELRRRLEDSSQRQPEQPSQPKLPGHLRHLDEEERAEVKDEPLPAEVRMAQGVAEDIVEPRDEKIRELEMKIAKLESERFGEKAKTREDKIWEALEKRVPGARQLDTDEAFGAFLQETDPDNLDGLTYGEVGYRALKKDGDVATLARIFNAFKELSGQSGQTTGSVPPVKPSESKGQAPTKQARKPMFTEAEIGEWYHTLKRNGADSFRTAEFLTKRTGKTWTTADVDARSKEIEDATREGRVTRSR